jgi:hypothetical protein
MPRLRFATLVTALTLSVAARANAQTTLVAPIRVTADGFAASLMARF